MNKPLAESDFTTPKVTTGPIAGSRKVYAAPDAAPDLRVPYREIALSEGAGEEPVRIYDPSGIYTEADAAIDVEKGLKRSRVEWVKERVRSSRSTTAMPAASISRAVSRTRRGRCAVPAKTATTLSPNSNGRAPASSPRK